MAFWSAGSEKKEDFFLKSSRRESRSLYEITSDNPQRIIFTNPFRLTYPSGVDYDNQKHSGCIKYNVRRMKTMIVTAWNNGKHHQSAAGYGLKIASGDRDKYFNRNSVSVFVQIEGTNQEVEVNINKRSFWGKICRELINKEIGLWLRQAKLAPWPKGNPPQLILMTLQGNHFRLRRE